MTEAINRSTLPASAGPTDDSPRPYSTVSYLAIGGLILAVAYATVMTIGVVIALFNRTPWILPLWSLAFPLGAALLCWAARVRIRNSEDALSGATLAAWGLSQLWTRIWRLLLRLLSVGHATGDRLRRRVARRPQERPARRRFPKDSGAATACRRRSPARAPGTRPRPRPRRQGTVYGLPPIAIGAPVRARGDGRSGGIPRRSELEL